MYGVVVCPRCKRARGVRLEQKTTSCDCGFEIRVIPARVRARTEKARDLPGLVGRVSAELAGGLRAYERDAAPRKRPRVREVHARVAASVRDQGDRSAQVRAAAVELTRELQVFSLDDWSQVLDALGIPQPEATLQALIAANALFEPKPGFFRAVGLTP